MFNFKCFDESKSTNLILTLNEHVHVGWLIERRLKQEGLTSDGCGLLIASYIYTAVYYTTEFLKLFCFSYE